MSEYLNNSIAISFSGSTRMLLSVIDVKSLSLIIFQSAFAHIHSATIVVLRVKQPKIVHQQFKIILKVGVPFFFLLSMIQKKIFYFLEFYIFWGFLEGFFVSCSFSWQFFRILFSSFTSILCSVSCMPRLVPLAKGNFNNLSLMPIFTFVVY